MKMARKYKVLQIGGNDLSSHFLTKEEVVFQFLTTRALEDKATYNEYLNDKTYDLIFVQTAYSQPLMKALQNVTTPYNTYIDQQFWGSKFKSEPLVRERMIRPFHYKTSEECIHKLLALSFSGQYGDKIAPHTCIVNSRFKGDAYYDGSHAIVLTGDFGKDFKPILSWQNYLVYDREKVIQIWPEYTVTGRVEVSFTLRLLDFGTAGKFSREFVLKGEELKHPLEIPVADEDAYILITAKAKGSGTLRVGAIHKRWSRMEMGQCILGGERYVDENREEFFHYFDPGDLKPPLNVYFSGYRTAEGFEGFYMMRKFKTPFLLIADPRVEGGAFYLGSKSFESNIIKVIQDKLKFLGFKDDDLILSGLSMGSFGALYYDAQLKPAAIVVGKPLVNIGTIAECMRLKRPEEFGTAIDVLMKNEKAMDADAIQRLNRRFWNVLEQSNIKETTVAVSYMEDDDYDIEAFNMLLPLLSRQHVLVMSRSIPGRHNDDSATITNWFVNFYNMILESRFGRVTHERKE